MSRMPLRRLMRRVLPKSLSLRLRREWLGRRIAAGQGGHFEDDIRLLDDYVKPTDIAWDIGANSGTYAIHLSRLASKVFAFEPVPHNADVLGDVIRRARLPNVTTSRLAISDRVGHARMTIPTTGFYGGFYLARIADYGELDVELSTVDALIAAGVPEPDFIKCDVEGAELQVLKGARELIERRHPVWLLETFDDEPVDLLRQWGYSAFVRDENHRLVEVHARVHERNYWFFPVGQGPSATVLDATNG